MKKASDKNYGEIKRAKKEVMCLATEVNPQAAMCATKLGQLFVRTPAFVVQLGIVEDGSGSKKQFSLGGTAGDDEEEDKLQRLPGASEPCDVFAGETWDIFETIDNLAQKAEAQCAASIVTLMGMLAAEERFPQVTQHLIRTVLDKAVLVQRKDAMAIRGGETAQSRSTGRRPTRRDRCAARRTPSGTGG